MQFILSNFAGKISPGFHHTWKNGIAKFPAFLDDYAFLIQALLHLQEITGETKWIIIAKEITEFVIENFSDEETPFFFYTPAGQQDVIIRKKEVYDGAVPSGNSVMAYNLYHLSVLFGKREWGKRSLDMILSLNTAIIRYPTSFGNWACLLQEIIDGTSEIAVVGKNLYNLHTEILQQYIPHRVLMTAEKEIIASVLAGKMTADKPTIYLCRSYTCLNPYFKGAHIADRRGRNINFINTINETGHR
jgi:hypothetical protein